MTGASFSPELTENQASFAEDKNGPRGLKPYSFYWLYRHG
jgi:hypothetical protein